MTAAPAPAAADPPAGPALTAEMLRAALSARIEPVRVAPGYRVALLLVALAVAVLPALYLGLSLLIAWLAYFHAVHNVGLLHGGGGLGLRAWLLYATPSVAGGIVAVWLLKPLFSHPARRSSEVVIQEREYPLAFELIRGICRAVGAPMPAEVTVHCHANAWASLRRGLRSFVGADLRLSIGLPLVTDLTVQQLAGILAHEMGHFAQGSAMRLTYLIRTINAWLARVVYPDDEADPISDESLRGFDFLVTVVHWLSRAGVWLSRMVLWMLLLVADAISHWMLRHMEYDADRYEVRVAGSETFATTALRQRVLGAAAELAVASLRESYEERRLCDDFPLLVAAKATQLPPELLTNLAEPGAQKRAGLFDTHPPDAARIARAERESMPGLLRLELPAIAAFPGLAPLARRATEAFYRTEHGIDLDSVRLVPTAEILARDAATQEDEAIRKRLFGALFSAGRPLLLDPVLPAPPPLAEARKILEGSRAALERLDAGVKDATARLIAADGRVRQARRAMALFEAGLGADTERFGAAAAGPRAADSMGRQALAEQDEAAASLGPARDAATARMATALALLASPELAVRRPELATLTAEATRLVETLGALATHADAIVDVWDGLDAVATLVGFELTDEEEVARRDEVLFARMGRVVARLNPVLDALGAAPYPFDHAQGDVSLAVFATADMPPPHVDRSAYLAVGHVMARLTGLHSRALNRLAAIVYQVEQAVGEECGRRPSDDEGLATGRAPIR